MMYDLSGHIRWPWKYATQISLPKNLLQGTPSAVIPSDALWCSHQSHSPWLLPENAWMLQALSKVFTPDTGGASNQHSLPRDSHPQAETFCRSPAPSPTHFPSFSLPLFGCDTGIPCPPFAGIPGRYLAGLILPSRWFPGGWGWHITFHLHPQKHF